MYPTIEFPPLVTMETFGAICAAIIALVLVVWVARFLAKHLRIRWR